MPNAEEATEIDPFGTLKTFDLRDMATGIFNEDGVFSPES
jgi:hypothetical protein